MAVTTPDPLDKTDLLLEDGGRVAVEPHDEASHDLQSGLLDLLDGGRQVAFGVLDLVAFRSGFPHAGFQSPERPGKSWPQPSFSSVRRHPPDSARLR